MRYIVALVLASMLIPAVVMAQSGKACTTSAECASPERCLDSNHKPGAGTCGLDCKPGVLDCGPGLTCQDLINGVGLCKTAPSSAPTGAAGQQQSSRTVKLVNPLKTESIPELVGNIIRAAVGVVGAFALLVFVYGGFLLLTSSGETAKIQAGKDAMKWSAIGIVVVFSSYALVSFVLKALGQSVK